MRSERIELVGASPAHVGRIAYRLREIDRIECGVGGRDPKATLRLALRSSTWAVTALLDGVPHAMFGVSPVSLVEDRGSPWFLGSDEVYRHGRELLAWGPRAIGRMHASFRRLENSVSTGNRRAIRLLGRWGFTIERDPFVVGGVEFVRFWRESDV